MANPKIYVSDREGRNEMRDLEHDVSPFRKRFPYLLVGFCTALIVCSLCVVRGLARFEDDEVIPAVPGGSLEVSGRFKDVNTDYVFQVNSNAEEDDEVAGIGKAFLYVRGPALSACDVHGPVAKPGEKPYQDIECGGSSGMSVAIDDEALAAVSVHGYVHADHPFIPYLGSTCIDLVLVRDNGQWFITIEIYTPKEVIVLSGTFNGQVSIDPEIPQTRRR